MGHIFNMSMLFLHLPKEKNAAEDFVSMYFHGLPKPLRCVHILIDGFLLGFRWISMGSMLVLIWFGTFDATPYPSENEDQSDMDEPDITFTYTVPGMSQQSISRIQNGTKRVLQ